MLLDRNAPKRGRPGNLTLDFPKKNGLQHCKNPLIRYNAGKGDPCKHKSPLRFPLRIRLNQWFPLNRIQMNDDR